MKVSYEVEGSGEPLLLVSGIGQIGKRWRRVVPLLTDTYSVVTFDNRETGGTGPSEDEFTLTDIAEDALDLMSELGFDRFFLAGISMGGMISQEIVRHSPGRVRAAVLFATHRGAPYWTPPADPAVLMPTDQRPVWAKLSGPGFWEANPTIIEEETALSVEAATKPEGYARQAQAIAQFDPRDEVRDAGVPIVVAHGDHDPLVPYDNGVDLAKHLGVELVTYDGAGHVLECERPQEMADLMRRHFTDH